jgi:iron complex outermembrane receptor protein
VAGYTYDWQNIQVARFEPTAGGNVVQNAARARVRGVEAQAAWRLGERTQLRANAAYTHGEYSDFPNATVTVSAQPDNPAFPNDFLPTAQSWSGGPTIRTPEWTANFGWRHAWSERLAFTGNVYYTSEFAPNTAREHPVTGEPDLTSGPYTLVNMGLAFTPSGAWSLTLYGRNLTDERYVLSRDANVFGEYRAFGEPRVIGLRFDYRGR